DAISVAESLGIEFCSYNFEREYREKVIQYFFDEYARGRTPNPDVLCNSEIKFNLFLKKCLQELHADAIATGHYAGISATRASHEDSFHLLKGKDRSKDQSYFLCRLTQEELARSRFPLGELTKPQVRQIAHKLQLPVAEKKDSQGICFVGKINVAEFIRSELGAKPGDIIDHDTGAILGQHQGLWFYTIGQREGLRLSGGPWFVVHKNIENNSIIVVRGSDHPALFSTSVLLEEPAYINASYQHTSSFSAEVSIRYRQKPVPATIERITHHQTPCLRIHFHTPVRAASPGQFGCIYKGDEIIGSGILREATASVPASPG
ncbi:MAG: tRNA 2-thiouridine(34) synthase MnmA, partial [Candidatus Dojkabacteria bacterium]